MWIWIYCLYIEFVCNQLTQIIKLTFCVHVHIRPLVWTFLLAFAIIFTFLITTAKDLQKKAKYWLLNIAKYWMLKMIFFSWRKQYLVRIGLFQIIHSSQQSWDPLELHKLKPNNEWKSLNWSAMLAAYLSHINSPKMRVQYDIYMT